LYAATGREPSVSALAARLGQPCEQVEAALQAREGRFALRLDMPTAVEDGESATAGDLIGWNDGGYERVEAQATIQGLHSILDDRAREILRLRFEEDLLQREIGERVGCSQMHVSRIIGASLHKLHGHAFAAGSRPA
jgi:RNA polymerase sigma-B factor